MYCLEKPCLISHNQSFSYVGDDGGGGDLYGYVEECFSTGLTGRVVLATITGIPLNLEDYLDYSSGTI